MKRYIIRREVYDAKFNWETDIYYDEAITITDALKIIGRAKARFNAIGEPCEFFVVDRKTNKTVTHEELMARY